jgi:hypothetical protein
VQWNFKYNVTRILKCSSTFKIFKEFKSFTADAGMSLSIRPSAEIWLPTDLARIYSSLSEFSDKQKVLGRTNHLFFLSLAHPLLGVTLSVLSLVHPDILCTCSKHTTLALSDRGEEVFCCA